MRPLRAFTILLCLILLPRCSNIPVPDIEVCTIEGRLAKGMNCITTISGQKRKMPLDEVIDFLEADQETGKGAAFCVSSKDFSALKSSLEIMCNELKGRCTPELKKSVSNLKKVKTNIQEEKN